MKSEKWDAVLEGLAGAEDVFFLETRMAGNGERFNYLFQDSQEIIEVRTPEEAENFSGRIECAVGDGCYAAGFFCYELGYCFEDVFAPPEPHSLPLLSVGIYRNPAIFDVTSGEWTAGRPPAISDKKPAKIQFDVSSPRLSETCYEYENKIHEIKRRIAAGDTYQINHTIRANFDFGGDPLGLYMLLRERQPTAYSAFWRMGGQSILSFSPELIFKIAGGEISTRPMKGTAARGDDVADDERRAEWLKGDKKNLAENLMIVDLLRNDLGRVATDVRVPELFRIERYSTLHQMTSAITARLDPKISLRRLFASLFPSGSVTGAPKISSMKIIRGLEGGPRGIYTGAIGFIAPGLREAVFNVAIRTIHIEGGQGELGIGGGIVSDSEAGGEWREALLKGEFFFGAVMDALQKEFSLVETILWHAGEGYFLFARHIERLAKSARHFDFCFDEDFARRELENAAESFRDNPADMRVRLLLNSNGDISVSSTAIENSASAETPRCTISGKTILSSNPLLYHKTTARRFYDAERDAAAGRGHFDVIFVNERGEVTEGARTNVVARIGGGLFTPPVECGLLGGVFRGHLIETGAARERVLYPRDIVSADELFLCNSVRGMVKVEFIKPDFLK